jgi:hypothetical protein
MSAIKDTDIVRNAVYFSEDNTPQLRAIWFPISKQAFDAETGEYIGHVHHDRGQMYVCRSMECDPLNN